MPKRRGSSAHAEPNAEGKASQDFEKERPDQDPKAPRRREEGEDCASVQGAAEPAAAAAAEAAAPSAGQEPEAEAEGIVAEGKARRKRQEKEVLVPEPEQRCFCAQPTGVRVGTSGFSYRHWKEGFYAGLPQRCQWERFSKEFDFLEINATFYGSFNAATYESWRQHAAAARPTFQYAVKAPQLLTHRKRLNVDEMFVDAWGRFWERCQLLRPHLGPILFQFPGNFRTTSKKGSEAVDNIDKLRRLGQLLPAGEKFVFEFRDSSWLCREVYDVLRQLNWCLAIAHCTDAPGCLKLEEGGWIGSLEAGPNPPPAQYPLSCCTWGVYVRFHGSAGKYCGQHGAAELKKWAAWAKKWRDQGRQVWFAFNNDALDPGDNMPAAIQDCRTLAAALHRAGVWPAV